MSPIAKQAFLMLSPQVLGSVIASSSELESAAGDKPAEWAQRRLAISEIEGKGFQIRAVGRRAEHKVLQKLAEGVAAETARFLEENSRRLRKEAKDWITNARDAAAREAAEKTGDARIEAESLLAECNASLAEMDKIIPVDAVQVSPTASGWVLSE